MNERVLTEPNYDVFVCYYEDAADDFAEKIHRTLSERGYKVFVAHLRRPFITGDFRETIDQVIDGCRIFLLINSLGALLRTEVIREISKSFPKGDLSNRDLWVFREGKEDVPKGTMEFQDKTGIDLSKINQWKFSTHAELVRVCNSSM